MDPTRIPFDRVVMRVTGDSSMEEGTLGGTCDGRSGPMRRLDDIAYLVGGGRALSLLAPPLAPDDKASAAFVRVMTGGSCRSGNSFSEYFWGDDDAWTAAAGWAAAAAAKDRLPMTPTPWSNECRAEQQRRAAARAATVDAFIMVAFFFFCVCVIVHRAKIFL